MRPLTVVARAARKAAAAYQARDQAVRDAYDAGESLRAVAEAAGISHEQVRRIIQKG